MSYSVRSAYKWTIQVNGKGDRRCRILSDLRPNGRYKLIQRGVDDVVFSQKTILSNGALGLMFTLSLSDG